jgi:excisionase family DNA binding protein
MKNGIIIPVTEEELKDIVQTCVNTALEKHLLSSEASDEILKMHEVCKLLSVSKPTVYSWIDQGRLKSYKIGSRKFFLRTEIMAAIKSNKLDK